MNDIEFLERLRATLKGMLTPLAEGVKLVEEQLQQRRAQDQRADAAVSFLTQPAAGYQVAPEAMKQLGEGE